MDKNLCICISNDAISIYVFDIPTLESLNTIASKIILYCIMGLGLLSVKIIWLIYIFYQKDIVNIANDLHSLDNNMKKCKFYSPEKDYLMYLVFIGNFVICNGVFLLEFCLYFKITQPMWAIPYMISSWTLTQYTLFLNSILLRFRNLNKMILKLGNINTEYEFDSIYVSKVIVSESTIINAVQTINYNYTSLCEISRKVAEFYSIPTLGAILYFVAIATYDLYYVLEPFVTNKYGDFSTFVYIETSSTFFMTFFNFLGLITNTIRISREVKNIAYSIHLLLDRCKEYPEVRNMIAGTIVTYLLILVQFRLI
ncbi:hypothetical protein KQX54_019659 [Cotesia glomerata]|uniref:Gustatory receptor n=1 Tax=Cotesia glomerata TaxID=32391 RepID=A0AAV7HYT3_COTGL|nr:hypothetical protein KQX54_019659 [Cotesia glomerata]